MKQSYPTWQTFSYKYQGCEQKRFEDLARNLFRKELDIKTGLLQRENQKGNETEVVRKDGRVYGFQAKFFTNGIKANDIIDSMRGAKESHPEQTHYYIYCNLAFGNPRRRKGQKKTEPVPEITQAEESIESVAKELGLTIVWKLNKAILDEVMADDTIYNIFFNVEFRQEKPVEKCTDKQTALKMLYDLLVREADIVDTYVIYIVNRGGGYWYINDDKKDLWGSINRINDFINDNRFYIDEPIYIDVRDYFNIARDLSSALDGVVQAIYSSDNPDALLDVFDITYDQDIHCNATFVQYIMDEFTQADGGHPAYNNFAKIYGQHEQLRNKIIAIIKK